MPDNPHNDRIPKPPDDARIKIKNAIVKATPYVVPIALVLVLLAFFGLGFNRSASNEVNETFVVKPNLPKFLRLEIRQGDEIDLHVRVVQGAPVDVFVGQVMRQMNDRIVLASGDLINVKEVRSLDKSMSWPGDVAIVVVQSEAESAVSLKASARRK